MRRDIYEKLLQWKSSSRRKPLLLKGARQVGKTYILKHFGEREYEHVAYLNFEEEPLLRDFFQTSLNPRRIIRNLSIYLNLEIRPEKDLIIFDEIQACNDALNSLKYFNEEANEYHIAAAGSLVGLKVSGPKSFPVGKVNFLNMYPLTFLEFLDAVGESRLRQLLEETRGFTPYPEPFHLELVDLLRSYYFVGGMPEAVRLFSESRDYVGVREIQKEILNAYVLDFAKHAPAPDIPKLGLIWESIPSQLGKENKKFMFSALKKTARARQYEGALQWLQDAGLVLRVTLARAAKLPLSAYAERGTFKIYSLDVGLLGALSGTTPELVTYGDRLFTEYRGALVENYVAQQLQSHKEAPLYYWKSDGMAEIDFLFEQGQTIFALEAKAGVSPRSKSLKVFAQKYPHAVLSRTTLLNLKHDGKVYNYPLYAIALFPDLSLDPDSAVSFP